MGLFFPCKVELIATMEGSPTLKNFVGYHLSMPDMGKILIFCYEISLFYGSQNVFLWLKIGETKWNMNSNSDFRKVLQTTKSSPLALYVHYFDVVLDFCSYLFLHSFCRVTFR